MGDVARLAGVSHQTVSRVLNDHPRVRPETRRRVEAAIEQLGYRRNTVARALVTRRSRTVGIVTFSSGLYGPASTLAGIQDAARKAGYFVTVASMGHVDEASVQQAVDHFSDQSVDGLIIITPGPAATRAAQRAPSDVPVVVAASGGPDRPGVLRVSIDQVSGAAMATRHLLDLGHDTVVHLAGPEDWYDARCRVAGWRSVLEAAGAPVVPDIPGDWTPERGYEVGHALVRQGLPTALFAANDHMALGLLRAFTEARVRVPDDVSVVGFDDVPGADFYSPPLTTVRQEFTALGRRCLEMLLAAVDGAGRPPAVILPHLVIRESTRQPRTENPVLAAPPPDAASCGINTARDFP